MHIHCMHVQTPAPAHHPREDRREPPFRSGLRVRPVLPPFLLGDRTLSRSGRRARRAVVVGSLDACGDPAALASIACALAPGTSRHTATEKAIVRSTVEVSYSQ